jgi:very-short-patch-repair endonuclease
VARLACTERLAAWADEHDGVVSRAEARALGLTAAQERTLVARGWLRELFPGVWAAGHRALRQRGWRRAAALAAGPEAHLDARTALAVHDLRPTDRLELVVPFARRPAVPGLTIRRTRCLPAAERTVVDGLPVVTVARAILGAAALGTDPLPLLARAEQVGRFDLVALLGVLGRGRPGSAALRRALATYVSVEAAQSELEAAFLRFAARHALPRPVMGTLVEGLLVDGVWRQARLVVELDGFRDHGRREGFEDDRARDARLLVAGWRVVRLTWARLRDEPEVVARQLRALLCT